MLLKNKNKSVLEIEINKEIECSAEIAKWNYWDHEHLDVIHGGYEEVDILYDNDNFAFGITTLKIPVIPFLTAKSPLFLVQHDENTQFTFASQFGVLSKTTIKIYPKSEKSCKITMNYKFYLSGWRAILRPLLKRLIPIWNEKVWQEDLPVKLRRQKVIDMGFKDFWGLPNKVEDRKPKKTFKLNLPIPRPKNSSRDRHPLKK